MPASAILKTPAIAIFREAVGVGQAGARPLPFQQEPVGGRVKAAAIGVLKVTHESPDAVGPAQHRRGPSSVVARV